MIGLGSEIPGVSSDIHGSVGLLKIRDTMQNRVHLASFVAAILSQLTIDSVVIGGALDNSGTIEAQEIGSVRIGGNIVGGAGKDSGRIIVNTLGQLSVGGGIFGGTGENSARLLPGSVDTVVVRGSVIGGSGQASAALGGGSIHSLKIGGDLVGGDGFFSGNVRPNELGSVVVGGNLIGGAGISSGLIGANDIDSVIVRGTVVGAKEHGSGSISANTIEIVRIGGDLVGGPGDLTGRVFGGGHLRSIGGSILGRVPASGNASLGAGIYATIAGIDIVTIGRDVIAANIVSGVDAGPDLQFSTPDDLFFGPAADSHIHVLAIKGHVASAAANVRYGSRRTRLINCKSAA